MWQAEKRKATFASRYYSIREAFARPKSVQIHRYVIMVVGASGEKYLLKVVTKYADKYNHPWGSPQALKKKNIYFKRELYCYREEF